MYKQKSLLALAIVLLATLMMTAAYSNAIAAPAKEFPTRAITLIIPWAAGGGTDVAARTLAALTEPHLGVSINCINIDSAGGAAGLTELYYKDPDGYSIALTTSTIAALKPQGRMDFSGVDYIPILGMQSNTYAIGVHADSPFKTIQEFVEYAKANPKKLTVGTGSVGTNLYLGAFSFMNAAGIELNIIPDPGGAASGILAVAGKNLDSCIGGPNEFAAQVEGGNIRLLAVMSAERSDAFPDVPTMKEAGIDTLFETSRFLIAPPKTPADTVQILHDAFKKAWDSEKWQAYLKNSGSERFYVNNIDSITYLKEQDEAYLRLLQDADLIGR